MELVKPEHFFQERFGLTTASLERALGDVLGKRVDDADLYIEYTVTEFLRLEEGIVKKAGRDISQGLGVRALAEEKTGYAFSDDVTVRNLEAAARTARAIAADGGRGTVAIRGARPGPHDLYPVAASATEVATAEKVALLQRVDAEARRVDPRVTQVLASFTCQQKIILVATATGLVAGDVRPLCRLSVTCIAEEGGAREMGTFGTGGRVGFGFFLEDGRTEGAAREAARQACLNLGAVEAPAGTLTVVLGPGWPGILLHEAVGHGLEGDFNRKGVSAFSGRLGERVASALCTVVDDGTIPSRRGSLNVDDEGTPTSRTVLIDRGILVGYLQDRLNARLMGMTPTGNGRRESYGHYPLPRMTNTFMLAGDADPEEIIRSVPRGLYAVNFGGGQVDITSGKFVFSASEAYLIEGGRVSRPVKGATLIGSGPDILHRVSLVGNDLKLDEGIGTCGKDGQSVPVGVGLPTIRIDGITVGGTRG